MNPLTGELAVDVAGQKYYLRYPWAALQEIEGAYGDNPNLLDLDVLAAVASIGMKAKHAEMTAERIKELSPPLVPFAQAVQRAIQYAYFGPDKPEQGEKKTSPLRPGGGWRQRIGSLLSRESTSSSSGG